ncbi:MAG TPA: protein kinase [Gaiella sp.]|uniref:protein kinase domain-containing protein n=1 Tax=Gaiella sp. TaxID=2663207 RepID=UPI002D7FFB7E|nr:protein kinase [Gaiella sp.]HET9286945.1 protein kinase [Gaiella sp.]
MERAETIVARRYRLLEQLGRGGMGVVWRARDERLERDVALKVLHPWVAEDPELRERFEREASALARLEHPNVVRLYDVLENDGQTVLVMELVEGDALDALISGRTLDWDDARRYCGPVAAALAHAHRRGVVHRDLTPANVLVEHGTGRIVVTDFGLARLARSSRSAPISGVLAGTPEYWAPEQAAGGETGPATDLYALGCILFRLLTGRMPFEGEDRLATGLRRAHEPAPTLAVAAPDAPAEAAQLVDRLLQRGAALRGDAVEAALALGADPASLPGARVDAIGPGVDPTQASPGTLVTRVLREPATIVRRVRSHRSVPRGRISAAAAALAVAVGLAGGGVYAIAGDDPTGVSAPDVVGLKVSAARAEVVERAREDDFPVPKVKVVDRSYSESAPAGAIVAQDPPEGKRIPENGALLVSVSKGSAYADVPSVAGLEGSAAFALLERKGFTPTRRYAPSMEIEAWHSVSTEPGGGTRVKRPARVQLVVSTGPPKRPVPSLDGLDANAAAEALRRAGFTPAVEERADSSVEPGSILSVKPSPGARTPLGSTVTVVVAREPRWEAISTTEGTEDAEQQVALPAGARLVLSTADTSPLGLWGGNVDVQLSGDTEGSAEIDAGEVIVLADASDGDRTIGVSVDVDGPAHWTLAVEVAR